jgi:hypothetical protein
MIGFTEALDLATLEEDFATLDRVQEAPDRFRSRRSR